MTHPEEKVGEQQQAKELVMQLVNSCLELDVVTCDVSLRVSGSDGSLDGSAMAVMLLADLRKCILELVGDNKKGRKTHKVVGPYQLEIGSMGLVYLDLHLPSKANHSCR